MFSRCGKSMFWNKKPDREYSKYFRLTDSWTSMECLLRKRYMMQLWKKSKKRFYFEWNIHIMISLHNFSTMKNISIKYRERPTPWFQSEFTLINNFRVKDDDAIGFIKDQLVALYLYHPSEHFENTVLDVWAEIEEDWETRRISWEDSDESDFRMFYTNLK